ncbi:interleukin-12 subunit beta [Osmerus eperlanus]|uniref:interleukin-12 subunit beta n=1 Tax=Osmerus eperlanus TaxID=29151 RepID=UPI002E15D782
MERYSLLSMTLCLLVCHVCPSSLEETYTLTPNVLVLRVNLSLKTQNLVPLLCGEAYEGMEVRWMKNGAWLSQVPRENMVEVLVEERKGGNFTCHNAAGEYLNHTLVLVQEGDSMNTILEHSDEYIHCWANNYSGMFRCSWKRHATRQRATVFLLSVERGARAQPCSMDGDGGGVSCMDNASCAFTEESQPISLTLHMLSHHKLEQYSKVFFLRDIVRPDQVPLTQAENQQDVFDWDYPSTWDTPRSFFPLLFQVKVVRYVSSCDATDHFLTKETSATNYTVTSHKPYRFCVQARDPLTNGPWSQLAQIQVKTKKMKQAKPHHH